MADHSNAEVEMKKRSFASQLRYLAEQMETAELVGVHMELHFMLHQPDSEKAIDTTILVNDSSPRRLRLIANVLDTYLYTAGPAE